MTAEKTIFDQCAEWGWHASLVPIAWRDDAIAAIARRHADGELGEAFYQEHLVPILEAPLLEAPTPRSIRSW